MFIPHKKDNKSEGFVLLYAVLAVTVILVVGLLITNIITKQILLSTTGRDSQFAYYAADSMRECMFYHYYLGDTFGGISPDPENPVYMNTRLNGTPLPLVVNIQCFDQDIDFSNNSEGDFEIMDDIEIISGSNRKMCVKARVFLDGIETKIVTDGYNVACSNLEAGSLRTVQRTVVQTI